jgi:beta-mannanase
MRSVTGAHFRFDWTVNAAIRPLPLAAFYPGDDVVDIVGVDLYDFDPQTGTAPWLRFYRAPDGGAQMAAFAKAHRKPLSIPEWGTTAKAGTDDPAFVNGIAQLTRTGNVAYQAYFFAHDSAGRLVAGAKSLSAYRRHFGNHGDSAGG